MADADERLLVEAAQRDSSKFGELYDRHFARVYAFVASRVRNRDAAEDVTADVFHRARQPATLPVAWRAVRGLADPSKDVDAVFERAVQAGATPSLQPVDQEYGERSGGVKDASGNHWYIATSKGEHYVPKGLHRVNVYLHPLRAEPVIAFLKRAFDAEAVEKYASPDGVVHHAKVRIGDSLIEMGEAHGPYQPMPTMCYLYVPNVDATYRRALEAGAASISEPADQPYGDRNAGVEDAFGNQWYIATQIRETR